LRARAAVFRAGDRAPVLEEITLAPIRADEVLVRIVASGICHTDLMCAGGRVPVMHPIVLGHEGAGVVEATGSRVTKVRPGDHVVLSFLSCGHCASCVAGKACYCHAFYPANFLGRRLDGSTAASIESDTVGAHFFGQSSFSTYSVANERNVVQVRSDAPLELLGPLGCGVQTGAGTVLNVFRPARDESFVVFGAGGVGLSAVMAAVIAGCAPIIVVEPNASRRALALELGATSAFEPAGERTGADIAKATGGGVLYALDTTGVPAVLQQAVEALAPRGQLALLTLNGPDAMLSVSLQSILAKGAVIRGVCEGESDSDRFIPTLVEHLMQGRLPLERLVRFYDLHEISDALADQESQRAIKPIIRMPVAR